MVNFEDGTLVKGAYVEINGVQYPVIMPEYSGNTPISAENLNKMQIEILKIAFPIGSRYVTEDETNPSEILGFGVWERFKGGKIAIGVDEDDTDFSMIGNTGGEKTHKLTIEEMPTHNHNYYYKNIGAATGSESIVGNSSSNTGSVGTSSTGGNQQHNNMPPYEVVGYMWIRRA